MREDLERAEDQDRDTEDHVADVRRYRRSVIGYARQSRALGLLALILAVVTAVLVALILARITGWLA